MTLQSMLATKQKNNNRGFTLAEIMVSVAIFATVMITGMGALVSMTQKLRVSQNDKKATDSLDFVLESITRELRLGRNYYSGGTLNNATPAGDPAEKRDGFILIAAISPEDEYLVSFEASDSRGYIAYFINDGVLYRDRMVPYGNVLQTEALTDKTQVIIQKARVVVMNTKGLDVSNEKQPLVSMQFMAYSPNNGAVKKVVQTLVSQRVLDR